MYIRGNWLDTPSSTSEPVRRSDNVWVEPTIYKRKVVLPRTDTERVRDDVLACPRNLDGRSFEDMDMMGGLTGWSGDL